DNFTYLVSLQARIGYLSSPSRTRNGFGRRVGRPGSHGGRKLTRTTLPSQRDGQPAPLEQSLTPGPPEITTRDAVTDPQRPGSYTLRLWGRPALLPHPGLHMPCRHGPQLISVIAGPSFKGPGYDHGSASGLSSEQRTVWFPRLRSSLCSPSPCSIIDRDPEHEKTSRRGDAHSDPRLSTTPFDATG
ncbi:hypothetical protein CTA1_8501, partial [Colletotrichum tanaceti]